ncbi:hypothetical protein [Eleftheria terrae]|uniref:hypothetical protein n=1 Tax=Eleftheria terrae TaxID=1597781 RepID=UPI00263BB30B|nr:hypothetical protein [Eleftheria terrae]WKB52321.1 hypothetical protein N7L95_21395 [Eleftheria terrae]
MQVTYTIATLAGTGLLIATAPDGADIEAAIAAEEKMVGETFDRADINITSGLTLTDDVEEGDAVLYSGFELGELKDAEGRVFRYAVRRAVPTSEAEFKRLSHWAKTLLTGDYGLGYQNGLRRRYYGERFGSPSQHEQWLEKQDDYGRGYRDGVAGREPQAPMGTQLSP